MSAKKNNIVGFSKTERAILKALEEMKNNGGAYVHPQAMYFVEEFYIPPTEEDVKKAKKERMKWEFLPSPTSSLTEKEQIELFLQQRNDKEFLKRQLEELSDENEKEYSLILQAEQWLAEMTDLFDENYLYEVYIDLKKRFEVGECSLLGVFQIEVLESEMDF